MGKQDVIVRDATTDEFSRVGELMVSVYSKLEGFPTMEDQPNYYNMLLNVGNFTKNPETRLLVAITPQGILGGAVVYFSDMKYYGSGGTATQEMNSGGFRLLAVDPEFRGRGIGKLLTKECIQIAKNEGQEQVIIHSTKAMQVAWKMYEKLGFERSKELDFMQGELPVYGFRLIINR